MKRIRHLIGLGLHTLPSSMATLPHPSHTYLIASSLSLHTCLVSTSGMPQKLQLAKSPQGLHKCPGSGAIAPQVLHVYVIAYLLFSSFNWLPVIFGLKLVID